MMYGEIERIKRTSLIKTSHSGRTVGRHRLERQPWEGRSTHICLLIHQIGRLEWLSRRLPKVKRHGANGNSYDDSERQNHAQNFLLNPLLILHKQPNEKSNRNRNSEEQALVGPAIEQERQADSHPCGVPHPLFFLDPGQSAEYQRAAKRRNRTAPVAVCPVAEGPKPNNGKHAPQQCPTRRHPCL